MRIKQFKPRLVYNGNLTPTLEVELSTSRYTAHSSVPIPLSVSKYEYKYVINNAQENTFAHIQNFIDSFNRILSPEIVGMNVLDQDKIDDLLIEIDGTFERSNLGVNSMIAVSQALAKLGALESDLPLFKYIRVLHDLDQNAKVKLSSNYELPIPIITIYRSGMHNLKSKIPAQEIMIYPVSNKKIKNDLFSIFLFLKENELVETKLGLASFLENLNRLSKSAKLKVCFGIDMAASRFYHQENDEYIIPNLTNYGSVFRGGANKLTHHYIKFLANFVTYIEDPYNEDHISAWKNLHDELNKETDFISKEIVGDDITATNIDRLEKVALLEAVNNVTIKPSQVGTVTEAIRFAAVANSYGLGITGSYRFGETEDDFIVDFSVGVNADYLRIGYFMGSEYISKINRLLRIADILD